MQYGKIKGIDKKASRFIIGTMFITDPSGRPEHFERLDDAWEQGVNVLDSAHSYGAPNVGSTEIALGKWLKSRGIKRDDIIITTKCGHPRYFDFDPFLCRNAVHSYDMESELNDSLTKLYTDYVDVLYLHRDDPETPVSEIIDTFNKLKKQGKVLAFGAANWGYDRIKEANDYAEATGQEGFSIVEEHYSVAEMLGDPFRAGSGSLSGPKYAEAREYLIKKGIPVASYSALSGGFCTGRFTREMFKNDPDSIPEGVRVGYCGDDNFTRVERAAELAKEKGVSIAQLCMAYTMFGALDVFPIIGAANHAELQSTLAALDTELTQAECDYIDLTSDHR